MVRCIEYNKKKKQIHRYKTNYRVVTSGRGGGSNMGVELRKYKLSKVQIEL